MPKAIKGIVVDGFENSTYKIWLGPRKDLVISRHTCIIQNEFQNAEWYTTDKTTEETDDGSTYPEESIDTGLPIDQDQNDNQQSEFIHITLSDENVAVDQGSDNEDLGTVDQSVD